MEMLSTPFGIASSVWVLLIVAILLLIGWNHTPKSPQEQMESDNEECEMMRSIYLRKAVWSMWVARGVTLFLVALTLFLLYSDEVTAFLKWYMTARW
jgi:hypothetical protein